MPQKDLQWIKDLDYGQLKLMFDLVYFLDIEVLIDLCSAFVACMFKGRDIEEIYKEWNISHEITPEIEEELKKKHNYLFKDSSEGFPS